MAALRKKQSSGNKGQNMNSSVPDTIQYVVYDNNYKTDAQAESVIDSSVFALSTNLMEMAEQWDGGFTIKQEIINDGLPSSFEPKCAHDDSTINYFIKPEVDAYSDPQPHIEEEEIDIKEETVPLANESCADKDFSHRNSNGYVLEDQQTVLSENSPEIIQLEPGYEKAYGAALPVVNVEMLHDFFINMRSLCQPKLPQGSVKRKPNEDYGDKAIEYVQLSRKNGKVSLKCRVTPNAAASEETYRALIIISERSRKIKLCQCMECSAEEVGCIHAFAFLLWLHRRTEDPSLNQEECFWTDPPPNMENKKFVMCKDFGEVAKPTDIDTCDFLQLFFQNAPKDCQAPILKYLWNEPSPDLHKLMIQFVKGGSQWDVDTFINFCRDAVTDEMCDNMFKRTADQGELWQEMQYARIMSSTLYTASRQNRCGSLKSQILGTSMPDPKAIKQERKLKTSVLKEVARLRRIQILHPAGVQLRPEFPIFGAALDGLTEEYCVLVKCASQATKMTKYMVENKIKEKFYCQLMLQLHLCKKQKGLFCVAAPNFEKTKTVYIIEVVFDWEYLLEKMETALRYWGKHIFPVLLQSYRN